MEKVHDASRRKGIDKDHESVLIMCEQANEQIYYEIWTGLW